MTVQTDTRYYYEQAHELRRRELRRLFGALSARVGAGARAIAAAIKRRPAARVERAHC